MRARPLVASALVLACSHPPAAPPPARAAKAGPAARSARPVPVAQRASFCPPDTEQVGAEPPTGEVIWCEDADGLKQGSYRSWYDSGALEEEGQYQDGKRVGVWRFFDERGDLRGTRTFALKVSVKLCVFERSSRRGLDGALVLVTNLETGDASSAQTDPFGRATVVVDSGPGRVEVAGPFPRPEVHVDLAGGQRPLPVGLATADVQRIVQRGTGRLAAVTSCAR
jgi:hypothetical protein